MSGSKLCSIALTQKPKMEKHLSENSSRRCQVHNYVSSLMPFPSSLSPPPPPPPPPLPSFPSFPPSVHFTLSLSLSLSSCCQASVWPLYHQAAVWGLETGWILLQDTLQLRVSGGLSGSFRGPRSKVYSRTWNTIKWVLIILLCATVGEVLSIQAHKCHLNGHHPSS